MTKNTRQPEKKRYYKQIAFILMIVMIAALAQASYAGGSRVATEKVARSAPVAEPADAGSASGKSHIPEKPPETGSASEKPHAPDEPPESGSAPEQTPDEPPESGSVPKEPSAPEQGAQNEGDDKNIPADAAAGHDAGQTPASGPAGSTSGAGIESGAPPAIEPQSKIKGKSEIAPQDTSPASLSVQSVLVAGSPNIETGHSRLIRYSVQANGELHSAVLVIPLTDPFLTWTDPSALTNISGGIAAGYEPSFTFTTHDGVTHSNIPCLVLKFWGTDSSGKEDPVAAPGNNNLFTQFGFKSGITPDGHTYTLNAYLFEGTGTGATYNSYSIAGGGESAVDAQPETIIASADETFSVASGAVGKMEEKSVNEALPYDALQERSFNEVQVNPSHVFTLTYDIDLNSSRSGEDSGRLYAEAITVSAVLDGYLAAGQPKSIKVYDATGTPAEITGDADISDLSQTSKKITFAVPGIKNDEALTNRKLRIVITFNENEYTNRAPVFGLPSILTVPQQVTMTPTMVWKPVAAQSPVTVDGQANHTAKFGWYQKDAAMPGLELTKKISYSGQAAQDYTDDVKAQWGGNDVVFTLEPSGSGIRQRATVGAIAEGIARFENIVPGAYQLTETSKVSNLFPDIGSVPIVVGPPDEHGNSSITITDTSNSSLSDVIGNGQQALSATVTNKTVSAGAVNAIVTRQKPFQYPYDNSVASSFMATGDAGYEIQLMKAGVPAPIATTSSIGGEYSNGIWRGGATFYNVPIESGYYFRLAPGISAGDLWTNATAPAIASPDVLNVSWIERLFDRGGFRLTKRFLQPDGSAVEPVFEAAFQLYTDAAGTDPAKEEDGTTPKKPILITNQTAADAIVHEHYREGTYYLKEIGLTVSGIEGFTPYAGNDVMITIKAGDFGAYPTSSAVGSAMGNDGVFTNRSLNGQLAVKGVMASNAATGTADTYTISGTGVNAGFSKTVTIPGANQTALEYLAEGDYTITWHETSDKTLLASSGDGNIASYPASVPKTVTVHVSGGTTASPAAFGMNTSPYMDWNGSVQTAMFVFGTTPDLRMAKADAVTDNRLSGARFVLYARSGADWEIVPKFVAAPAVSGSGEYNLVFADLPSGTYKIAEYAAPANYVRPSYWEHLWKDPAVTASPSDLKTTLTDAETAGMTSVTMPSGTWDDVTASAITNAAFTKLTLNTKDASAANISGTNGNVPESYTYSITDRTHGGTFTVNLSGGNGALTLTPGAVYQIEQTANTAPTHLVNDSDSLTITINGDGTITDTVWNAGSPAVVRHTGNTAPVNTAAPRTITATFGVLPPPVINITKFGETDVWESDGYGSARLPGAGFMIYYRSGTDNYYLTEKGAFNTTPNTTAGAYEGFTDASGNLSFPKIQLPDGMTGDNIAKYGNLELWIEETTVPHVIGDPGRYYEKMSDRRIRFVLDGASGWFNVIYPSGGIPSGSETEYPAITGGSSRSFTNTTEMRHIHITKGMYTSQAAIDNGGEPRPEDIELVTTAYNAKFAVFRYEDWTAGGGTYESVVASGYPPIDELVTGFGGNDPTSGNRNTAWSNRIPAGKYVIVEVRAPLGYAPPLASPGSIYYTTGAATNPVTGVDLPNPWGHGSNALIVDLTSTSSAMSGEGNDTLDVWYADAMLSDSGYDGTGAWVFIHGEKNGYVLSPTTGGMELLHQGPLDGVEFKAYQAYRTADGKYARVPDKIKRHLDLMNDIIKTGTLRTSQGAVLHGEFMRGQLWLDRLTSSAIGSEMYDWLMNELTPADRAQVAADVDAEKFFLVLVESKAASGYSASLGNQYVVEYGKDDFLPSTSTVNLDFYLKHLTGEHDMKNIKGSGSLTVTTQDLFTGSNLSGASYDVYYSTTPSAATAVHTETWTFDTSAAQTKRDLKPGYYWFKEAKAPEDHHPIGNFAIKDVMDGSVPPGTTTTINALDDRAGSVFIGGIVVADAQTSTVVIRNIPYPALNILNTWEGDEPGLASEYELLVASGSAYELVGTKSAIKGAAVAYNALPDGAYRLKEYALNAAADEDYLLNGSANHTPASSYPVTFRVSNGAIEQMKVQDADITVTTASIEAPDSVWLSNDKANEKTISVNHLYRGKLIVQKGWTDSVGDKQTGGPGQPTFAAFRIDPDPGSGAFTWYATGPGVQGVNLPPGVYTVRETDTSAGHDMDVTPVYVNMAKYGRVYLQNAQPGLGDNSGNALNEQNSSGSAIDGPGSPWFYNGNRHGDFAIRKIVTGPAVGPPAPELTGAQFDIYMDTHNIGIHDPDETTVSAVIAENLPDFNYYGTLPEGDYLVKETVAPTGYEVNPNYIPLHVTAMSEPAIGAPGNIATVVDPPLTDFTLKKTTDYPAVYDKTGTTMIVPTTTAVVGELPMTLYRQEENGVWTSVGGVSKHTGGKSGTVAWDTLGYGVYKVVERPRAGYHDYLPTDSALLPGPDDGPKAENPSFEITYSALTGGLAYLENSDAFNAIDAAWSGADYDKMLTVKNGFVGFRFAAKAVWYDTDADIADPDVKFRLWKYSDFDPATGTGAPGATALYSGQATAADAVVAFGPQYLSAQAPDKRFVVELLDETQADLNAVVYPWNNKDWVVLEAPSGGGADNLFAVFRLKQVKMPGVAPIKEVRDAASGDWAGTVNEQTPLNESGWTSRDYRIHIPTEGAAGVDSDMPISAFVVSDAGLKFKGNSVSGGTTLIASEPAWYVTSVTVGPSTSQMAGADGGLAPPSAVYASINGGQWTLVDLQAGSTITYSHEQGVKGVQVAFAGTDTGGALGAHFSPGLIEYSVAVEKQEDSDPAFAAWPEITAVDNAVNVWGTDAGGHAISGMGSASVTVEKKRRPPIFVQKKLTDPDISNVMPGNAIGFTMTLTNTSNETLKDPFLVDDLGEDMHVKQSGGNYEYEVDAGALTLDSFDPGVIGTNLAVWKFKGDLEPGASVEVRATFELEVVVVGDEILNSVYGGVVSDKTDAHYSDEYPHGAYFCADPARMDPLKASVYDGAPGALDAAYEMLTNNGDPLLRDQTLFVKATAPSVPVVEPGKVTNSLLHKVNDGPFTRNLEEVKPGDTVTYRMQLHNGNKDHISGSVAISAASITNINLLNILPFPGDKRKTLWNEDLRDLISIVSPGSFTISLGRGTDVPTQPAVTASSSKTDGRDSSLWWAGSVPPETPEASSQAMFLDFGDFILTPRDTLSVEFTIKISDKIDPDILRENVQRSASDDFWFRYMEKDHGTTVLEAYSNRVTEKLVVPPVGVSGVVWDDADRDGIRAASEGAFAGMTATLYSKAGLVEMRLGDTFTGLDGTYSFANLVSSYGMDMSYKVVFTNNMDDAGHYRFTQPNIGAASTDSDAEIISSDHRTGETEWFVIETDETNWDAGIYKLNQYQVVWDYNDGSRPPHTASVWEGDQLVRIDDPVRPGYNFVAWHDDTPGSPSLGDPYTVWADPVSHDIRLKAEWEKLVPPGPDPTYSVFYKPGASGVKNMPANASGIQSGANVRLSSLTPVRVGYKFDNWGRADDGKIYKPGDAFKMPAHDVTLTARWTKIVTPPEKPDPTYSVFYNPGADGVVNMPPGADGIRSGANVKVSPQTPTRSGYKFKNWRRADDGKIYKPNDVFKMPSRDVTLTARWTKIITPAPKPKPPVPGPKPPKQHRPAPLNPPAQASSNPPATDQGTSATTGPPVVAPVTPAGTEHPQGPTAEESPRPSGEPLYEMGPFGVPEGSGAASDVWSLLSLILSLIAFLMAALTIIAAIFRKERDEEMWSADEARERRRRSVRRIFRPVSVGIAFIVGIVWLSLDDLSMPMAWINHWTLLVAVLFIAFMICFALFKLAKRVKDGEYATDQDGNTRAIVFDEITARTGLRISDEKWCVNGDNEKLITTAVITLILAIIGATLWIIMARISVSSGQPGGVIFLILTGIPGLLTAAFDKDWILLGDEEDNDGV